MVHLTLILAILVSSLTESLHSQPTLRGHLVDETGTALPEGTELEGRIEWHHDQRKRVTVGLNGQAQFVPVRIGKGGAFELSQPIVEVDSWASWVHLRRMSANGSRERAFAPTQK